MTEMIYEYDGSFEGFLTCIFESYAQKEVLTAISCGEDIPFMLFPVRTVLTDRDHAARVYRKVVKLSPEAADLLRRGFLTCLPDREMHLYRLVVKLLEEGPRVLRDLSDETLYPILRAVRHLNGEVHQYKGFVRFSDLGGVLGGEIEPKNRVLPLLRRHFCDRYRNERFFLYDRTHQEALFYAEGRSAVRPLEHFQMAPPDEAEARYRLLWAPNPGQRPQPLDKIASGGELSRFLLAVVGVQSAGEDATLIFDEVDAGVGGITLNRVSDRLHDLASRRQLLIIPHWPQLAARAAQHFQVSKEIRVNETFTLCRQLDARSREAELRRMAGEES